MKEAVTAVIANLGDLNRIPLGEGREFQVGSESIAVFRTRDGGVYATQATCTHKAGPLADGVVGDCTIVCPLHTFGFDLRSGTPLGHACEALKTHAVTVNQHNQLIVEVDQP